MRILALDYGESIGVAISDSLGIIAQGLDVIDSHDKKRLIEIINEYKVERIVLGFPKTTQNTKGEQCQKVMAFKNYLNQVFDIEVVLWDERFSTLGAERNLLSLSRQKRKAVIDKMAAVFILRGYLDYLNNMEEKKMDDNVIVMFDDEGNEEEFLIVGEVGYNDNKYLIVSENKEYEDEQEVIVLQEMSSDDENVDYQIVEDDETIDKVIEMFEDEDENEDEE